MGFFSSIGKAVGSVVGGLGGSSGIGSILGGVGGILGGVMGANSASNANAANAAIAKAQMDFQERMRKTAYQDAVKDMQKAGLNPMLAYSQGGAAVPSGASAEMKPTVTPELVNSAFNAAAQMAQIQQIKAQTNKTNAETAIALEESKTAPEFFLSRAAEQTAKASKTSKESEKLQRQRDSGLWDKHPVDKIKAEVAQAIASAENIRSANQAAKMFMQSDDPMIRALGAGLQLIFK